MIEIKHRYTQAILKTVDAETLRSADLRGADLRGADLSGAYLIGSYLSGADLNGAYLRGADLRGAYLSGAYLRDAYLRDAYLSGADLNGADLRGAYLSGLSIPIIPNIDAAILVDIEAAMQIGPDKGLKMETWHTCESAHCRAGWAIHHAGEVGYALEKLLGPSAAGALIYAVSRPNKRVPDFVASDEEALADIRACAAEQLRETA